MSETTTVVRVFTRLEKTVEIHTNAKTHMVHKEGFFNFSKQRLNLSSVFSTLSVGSANMELDNSKLKVSKKGKKAKTFKKRKKQSWRESASLSHRVGKRTLVLDSVGRSEIGIAEELDVS